ncbi:MAG: twin-arginine translocase subunit TatC [Armatimonadetes bacterium CG_4_10_14_0_8_um_filter_66_14]|nr:MAG: twin-arginine translocase subunit TatC [Armatimonadetes bacterium CG_4_10_14_0_8_um_filter_66_14]
MPTDDTTDQTLEPDMERAPDEHSEPGGPAPAEPPLERAAAPDSASPPPDEQPADCEAALSDIDGDAAGDDTTSSAGDGNADNVEGVAAEDTALAAVGANREPEGELTPTEPETPAEPVQGEPGSETKAGESATADSEPSPESAEVARTRPGQTRVSWLAVWRTLRARREPEPPGGREQDFFDHLTELRDRLIKILLLAVVGTGCCWSFYDRQTQVVLIPGDYTALLRVRVHLVPEPSTQKAAATPEAKAQKKEAESLRDQLARLEERVARLEERLQVPETPSDGGTSAGNSLRTQPPPGRAKPRVLLVLPSLWGFLTGPVREPLENKGIRTVFQSPLEPLLVRFQVVAVAGIVFLSPAIFYQIWAFIWPALYGHERKAVGPVIPASFLLFWCGVALAYTVIPIFFLFLLGFATGEAQVLNFVKWYIPFLAKVCLSMGLVFQMPIVFWMLGKLRIVTAGGLMKVWRHAIVVIFIVSAIITPTWDPFNLCLMALPICALYFLSVFLVWLTQRTRPGIEPPSSTSS